MSLGIRDGNLFFYWRKEYATYWRKNYFGALHCGFWNCSHEPCGNRKALIRIQYLFKGAASVWEYRKLQIIPKCRRIFNEGEEILLTKIEFDIICFLAQQNGRVVTYKELYEAVWNREYLQDDANIMAHIHRIRQKVERDIKNPKYIQNVYGVGYRFGEFAQ